MITRLFNNYINWWNKHYTKRRKWIVIGLATLTLVAAFILDTKKADAYPPSQLPHGAKGECHQVWFWQQCSILVQPGSAWDINKRLEQYPSTSSTVVSAIIGFAVCTAIPPAAPFCAIGAAYRSEEAKNAFVNADTKKRCVRIRFKLMMNIPGVPVDFRIEPYGQPQRWMLHRQNIDGRLWEFWRWGNPDSCKTRNPCVSIGNDYGPTGCLRYA